MKEEQRKKAAAPTAVCALSGLFYVTVGILFLYGEFPIIVKIFFALWTMASTGMLVYVLAERIKERRRGENDDLSKY